MLILEADQAVTAGAREESRRSSPGRTRSEKDGFYIRRRQIFRGKPLRFGGYGSKYLLKLFRRSRSELDPVEQDTRVYVRGPVGRLRRAARGVEPEGGRDPLLSPETPALC